MLNFIKKQGFSLAEMSVVMVIVGFIASSAISVAIRSDYSTKRDETESKMLHIEEALAGYLSTNHRLPCPADGTLAITDANFGIELSSGSPPVCTKNFHVDNVWGGVVPIKTLQLPDDFMFDGWGRRMDYVVDYRFTISENSTGATCDGSGSGSDICFRDIAATSSSTIITVKNQAGETRASNAIYVLLSHGENGHGAFPKTGSATSSRINGFPSGNPYRNATASADEFTNAKVDNTGTTITPYTATFVMRDYTRNDDTAAAATERTYFDDQLHYKTKSQLVKAAGASIYEAICKTAIDIINGSNDCVNAADNTQCETFVTEINSKCLQ